MGILYATGVFNPDKFSAGKQCGGFDSLVCQDFKVNISGALVIVLNNGQGTRITSFTSSSGTDATCTPTSIAANGNTTCTINGFIANGGTTGTSFDQTNVLVSFTDSKSGISHNQTGFVKGKFE
ncbi:hypothetical protein AUJ14_04155 [Candidatus Micrarchaeota archaeon CG1_02_55_22]|nr:MAG: hypothetical protein AUJ14_04155 [Candidatus Micrarchaeota archaeon CG1_02_55_22]